MRRRAPEFRRPVSSRPSEWICWLAMCFVLAGLLLFYVRYSRQGLLMQPILDMSDAKQEFPNKAVNFTEELWSATSLAGQLVDQMSLAKSYLVIAKEQGNLQFAWQLSSQIRNCQRLLSHAAVEGKPFSIEEAWPIIRGLSRLIYNAQDFHYDASTTIITMKKNIEALEGRLKAVTVQSAEFGWLAVEALPKTHHCLDVKLAVDWDSKVMLRKLDEELKNSPRLVDNNLYHFCIFSDNLLATSVIVNSTVSNADHPQQLVFHVVTNGVSYQAMKAWFRMHNFQGSTVEVRNLEEFSWFNASYSPILKNLQNLEKKFYSDGDTQDRYEAARIRDLEYAELLKHLRFYIPEILPSLEKVVFLDDDVVIQKDLTSLFSLNLHGNVNGAVETCLESSHRYHNFLNFSSPLISSKFEPQACGWAFGMNVFDLITWKKVDATAKYHQWQEQNVNQTLWRTGTLAPGLLTFHGLTEPLDRRWHVLGLGFDMDIDDRLIQSAAVVHFNGHMKPWLGLSTNRYTHLWKQYLNISHPYLRACHVS